mmetsp:Transcript_6658/g.10371  ORF Transcript_6658/g.10371 Transcript_6658/m.10371 type:complete len:139 (-) Transcript_6658:385-801(-)|eukprot:CAMPEP_0184647762 /NCGR_PEP_ID=MMETSP0308-20130426/4767_1 /TAXON_ID=38269 /ORGANISM="Gloeochaete witrockiana, Strain SAG 46.84" /LENGTH=138 /DNA_ID=CAMNT_0027079025 /DNA_START=95 /DNA_END=511 /DNA_ORIENTATION=-
MAEEAAIVPSSEPAPEGQEQGLRPRTNKIQVSNTKKPLYFYINLAKRFLRTEEEVELSALGNAISTVVTIAEILKENNLAVVSKINTTTVDMGDTSNNRYRPVQKAKIQINLKKSERFFELVDAPPPPRKNAGPIPSS